MSLLRCCCGGCSGTPCNNGVGCTDAANDCVTNGVVPFSVHLRVRVRASACTNYSCGTKLCEGTETNKYCFPTGCNGDPRCTPHMYYTGVQTGLNIGYVSDFSVDPMTHNGQCYFVWSDAFYANPYVCNVSNPGGYAYCFDSQFIGAGCAILNFLSVERTQTISFPANFEPCPGYGTVDNKSATAMFGWPCGCCPSSEGNPCCCDIGECSCDCRAGWNRAIAMEGITDPEQGVIRASVAKFIPCGQGADIADLFKDIHCGGGCCDGNIGYSYILLQLSADIPSEKQLIPSVGGCSASGQSVQLPDGSYAEVMTAAGAPTEMYCVDQRSINVLFRKCRSSSDDSAGNKCRMTAGTYEPVFIGLGTCDADTAPCLSQSWECGNSASIRDALKRRGWDVIEVTI